MIISLCVIFLLSCSIIAENYVLRCENIRLRSKLYDVMDELRILKYKESDIKAKK